MPHTVIPDPALTQTRPAKPWPVRRWIALLGVLALATVVVHGFHPFTEDGGVYAAGIEYTLNPSLFPHYTAFVTEHLRFSLFAPAVALVIRSTHLPLAATLLFIDLLAAFVTLFAARELLRRCLADEHSQLAGLALLAAGWSLPIAGTSLYLMDPYVTARTLTLPLSMLAIAFALDNWPRHLTATASLRHPALRCAGCLVLAGAFHPLMAAYALLFVTAVKATKSARSWAAWALLTLAVLLLSVATNTWSPAETPAETLAVITRYYWFLSQWHWYERLGLLGPLVMLGLTLIPTSRALSTEHLPPQQQAWATVARAAILVGLLCTLCALCFAHESAPTHVVARLQPLRVFVLVYAVMLLLLGATIHQACARRASQARSAVQAGWLALPALAAASMAAGLLFAERATYPASPHIESPWQAATQTSTHNPWVQAFLWARANTPLDALFALDARYVNTAGEDAQTFRAISLRSALPDYSKDGGEASITPALAPAWLAGANAQKDLSELSDSERDRRLQPFAVSWMVLAAPAATAHPCPYNNGTVKVCSLGRAVLLSR